MTSVTGQRGVILIGVLLTLGAVAFNGGVAAQLLALHKHLHSQSLDLSQAAQAAADALVACERQVIAGQSRFGPGPAPNCHWQRRAVSGVPGYQLYRLRVHASGPLSGRMVEMESLLLCGPRLGCSRMPASERAGPASATPPAEGRIGWRRRELPQ